MIKRLNISLFKPEEIGKFLKDKVGYVILYILFLSLIVSIPVMIRISVSKGADEQFKENFIAGVQRSEFNGKISNYKYEGDSFSPVLVDEMTYFGVKTSEVLKLGIVFVLQEQTIDVFIGGQRFSQHTLEELKLDTIDFSLTESVDRNKLDNALDIVYLGYKSYYVFYSGFSEVLGQAFLAILLILLFVWMYSWTKPKILMKYRFILAGYASTIYFFTVLLENLTGLTFISIIGIFLVGFYLRKAYGRIIQVSLLQNHQQEHQRKDQEEDEEE